MTLGEKQRLFTHLVIQLIQYAHSLGYEITFGEALRSDEQAIINSLKDVGREAVAKLIEFQFPDLAIALRNNGKASGIKLSIHQDKLAIDLNLFKDGVYLSDTESHRPLGEYWKTLHPLCRWGGEFRDGNHYSLEHEGRR